MKTKMKLIASALALATASLTLAATGMAQEVSAQVSGTQTTDQQVTYSQTTSSQTTVVPEALGYVAPFNHFVLKVGAAVVMPKHHSGKLLGGALESQVSNNTRPSISLEYLITPNIGVEVLGAYPFHNNIEINGAQLASVNVLPPTLSVQYHFLPGHKFSPFIGVGVNWTLMYNATINATSLGIPDATLHVGNSWGVVPHVGLEYNLSENWLVSVDARWIQMRNSVDLGVGNERINLGNVNVNPWVFGIQLGFRF